VLNDPVLNRETIYDSTGGADDNFFAKGTRGETLRRQVIPLCPCTPYVVLADMQAMVIASKKPSIDIEFLESVLDQFEVELIQLKRRQVFAGFS